MGRRNKYSVRSDGSRETSRTYTVRGKRIKKHFYGKTDADVDKKIAEYEKSLDGALDGLTRHFKEVAAEWWKRKEPELSPSCVRNYDAIVRLLISEFGDYRVSEITPQIIITVFRKWAAQGFTTKTISNRKTALKSILDDSLIEGEINTNPCVALPLVRGKSSEKRPPASEDDVALIEAHKTDDMISRMHYFMLYTGCRRGEAAALQWQHVDLKKHKARICQTVVYQSQLPEIKASTKTEAGIREIDLYDNVIEILPPQGQPDDFVFFPNGLPHESTYEKAVLRYRARTGVQATPHQLRHSYASMLHSAGVDAKDAQHLLGHSNISVTLDIYTELEKAHKEDLRNQINDYIKNR